MDPLIQLLRQNARTPTADLARELNLSESVVVDRIARLESDGVLLGYQAVVDSQKVSGSIVMDIQDDGTAFDVKRILSSKKFKRLGLIGMRERVEMVGGTFTIESVRGKGTLVRAKIPFSGIRDHSTVATK